MPLPGLRAAAAGAAAAAAAPGLLQPQLLPGSVDTCVPCLSQSHRWSVIGHYFDMFGWTCCMATVLYAVFWTVRCVRALLPSCCCGGVVVVAAVGAAAAARVGLSRAVVRPRLGSRWGSAGAAGGHGAAADAPRAIYSPALASPCRAPAFQRLTAEGRAPGGGAAPCRAGVRLLGVPHTPSLPSHPHTPSFPTCARSLHAPRSLSLRAAPARCTAR